MATIPPWVYLRAGSLKQKLLVYFFTHPNVEHYVRELAVLLNTDPTNLSRELAALEREGLFQSRLRGNQKHVRLKPAYPLYEEIRSIITKTAPAEFAKDTARTASVYVIAGPNGAGKTTFAKKFLPDYLGLDTFINADLIAGGIAPLAPEHAALKAGKLLLEEIRAASLRGKDFAFETTLSGKSYVHLFHDLIGRGYAVHMFFLWIPNLELALKRIAERVRRGGHHIPESVVRRRFHRGIQNFFSLYEPLASSWTIFDNAGEEPQLIAYEDGGSRVVLREGEFTRIMRLGRAS